MAMKIGLNLENLIKWLRKKKPMPDIGLEYVILEQKVLGKNLMELIQKKEL